MFRPRIIPVLLLKNNGLVKSFRFSNHRYIGDPINAVRIFNNLKADELAFLDIEASQHNRSISLDFVKKVGEEANMPFSVGGGIRSLHDIEAIIKAGAEKVVIGSYAAINPDFIAEAVNTFGSSTICVCMDVKKTLYSSERVYINNGKEKTNYQPDVFAKLMEEKGVGELIVQSITQDGTMSGYNIKLLQRITEQVSIPVTALGGAGNLFHLKEAYLSANVTGLAAGSLFVFHGQHKGVLINYPNHEEKQKLLASIKKDDSFTL